MDELEWLTNEKEATYKVIGDLAKQREKIAAEMDRCVSRLAGIMVRIDQINNCS